MSASATAEAATNAKNSLRRIFSSSPVSSRWIPHSNPVRSSNQCLRCSYPIYQFACLTPTSLRLAEVPIHSVPPVCLYAQVVDDLGHRVRAGIGRVGIEPRQF